MSPFLVSGTITGPFWPLAAWWMWAIVPVTPWVVTLPVTVPSSATRKVPLPFACVVTGGTSSAPVRLTFMAPLPGIHEGMLEHEASAATARTAKTLFIFPPLGFEGLLRESNIPAARIFQCLPSLPPRRSRTCGF